MYDLLELKSILKQFFAWLFLIFKMDPQKLVKSEGYMWSPETHMGVFHTGNLLP